MPYDLLVTQCLLSLNHTKKVIPEDFSLIIPECLIVQAFLKVIMEGSLHRATLALAKLIGIVTGL